MKLRTKKLCLLVMSVLAAASAGAAVRTADLEWEYDPSGVSSGVAVLVRAYVGPAFAGAGYDNLVAGLSTTMPIEYDLPPGRYSVVATAEQTLGPLWTASTVIAAGGTVVPRLYSMARGDVYYTSAAGGTTGATEPEWPAADGATITDGTVVWTAHNITPKQWTPNTAYAAGDLIAPPISAGLPGWLVFLCASGGTSGATEPNWRAATPTISPKAQWDRQWRRTFANTVDGTALWTPDQRGGAGNASGQSNRIVLQVQDQVVEAGKRWN